MSKAKRKTLPKNFEELLKEGDHAMITAALELCEPDAYGAVAARTLAANRPADEAVCRRPRESRTR